jgi:tetratricopeptide (TPR) repeat protein
MPIKRRRLSVSLGVCVSLGAASLFAAGPKAEEGLRLFETGRYGPARTALEAAAREDPKDARVALHLGRALLAADELDNAVVWLEKAVALDPKSLAFFQIGVFASVSGERLERGEQCLKLYLQHSPKPDEPSLASAHYRLGLLYEKKGNPDLARREYSAALELDSARKDVREALKKIS